MSVGFGVFMGIIPIWGFQLVAAIALAFFFRLNKALVIISANISIPPMIPLILYLSHQCGRVWMGDKAVSITFERGLSIEALQDSILQYVFGAITLAVCAGLLFSMVTYFFLLLMSKPAGKE